MASEINKSQKTAVFNPFSSTIEEGEGDDDVKSDDSINRELVWLTDINPVFLKIA